MDILHEIFKWYGIGCVISAILFVAIVLMAYKNNSYLTKTIFPLISLMSWGGVFISMILLIKLVGIEIRLQRIKSKNNLNRNQ
jgi:hypothetical protein